MIEPVLTFDEVSVTYDQTSSVLRDVSYDFAPGSFHFLTGVSGAGKSTFMKLISMEQMPSSGSLRLFGKDSRTFTRDERALYRQKIGIVFQDFKLLDHLTIHENVALPLKFAENQDEVGLDHVTELLEWVHLGDKLDEYPPAISGGEKQRVAIARAIINRPSILIADEPTGNVEDAMARKIISLFEQLNEVGTTVILATHNESLIEEYNYPVLRIEDHDLHLKAPRLKRGIAS